MREIIIIIRLNDAGRTERERVRATKVSFVRVCHPADGFYKCNIPLCRISWQTCWPSETRSPIKNDQI